MYHDMIAHIKKLINLKKSSKKKLGHFRPSEKIKYINANATFAFKNAHFFKKESNEHVLSPLN